MSPSDRDLSSDANGRTAGQVTRSGRRIHRAAYLVLLGALAAGALACHSGGGEIRDARAESAQLATQRLQGTWVLQSFQPVVPLEGALQLLLAAQVGRFAVAFNGQYVDARGPGLTVRRSYKVEEAYGDRFRATVYDDQGIGQASSCEFTHEGLVVDGMESPWRGRALFRRGP